ncbi:MAG: SET domain-containing protein [Saprospiraceae bacterium]
MNLFPIVALPIAGIISASLKQAGYILYDPPAHSTQIHWPEVGYGVFATQLIPQGTITYVKDSLEIIISPEDYLQHSQEMQDVIEKYSYKDENGYRIVSWDFAKYVNHCCQCNTISTGYGFEIAIRDIYPGEQITDEYGIFNLDYCMDLQCGETACRKRLTPQDFDAYYSEWDAKICTSLPLLHRVPQPLWPLLEENTRRDVEEYLRHTDAYRSVYALRMKPLP